MLQLFFVLLFVGAFILTLKITRIESAIVVIRFNLIFTKIKIKNQFEQDAQEMIIYINHTSELKSELN